MDSTSSYFTGIMTGILLTGMILGFASYGTPAAQLHRIEKLLEAAQQTATVTTIVTTTVTQAAPPTTAITVNAPHPGIHSAVSRLNTITYADAWAGVLSAVWPVAVVVAAVLIAEAIRLGWLAFMGRIWEAFLGGLDYYHEAFGLHYEESAD